MQERGVKSHRVPYPLEQLRQLVALHVAHPELLVEDWSPDALLLEAIAKADMRRSVLDPLHRGQEIELTSLLDKHSSSNSVSHCTQRNSYMGIDTHLWDLLNKKTGAKEVQGLNFQLQNRMERATGLEPVAFSLGS
jgi:hypothetical protein